MGGGLLHDERMVALIKIAVKLLADAARFAMLLFRPTQSIRRQDWASRFLQGSLTGEMCWSK
jgi:hypothetical protein